ncbi:hypothetical protein J6590_002029 [Homalodisca vitripennis]|nr:hypothetical protein J6590_002029 [Homalodisca vitripennis]
MMKVPNCDAIDAPLDSMSVIAFTSSPPRLALGTVVVGARTLPPCHPSSHSEDDYHVFYIVWNQVGPTAASSLVIQHVKIDSTSLNGFGTCCRMTEVYRAQSSSICAHLGPQTLPGTPLPVPALLLCNEKRAAG